MIEQCSLIPLTKFKTLQLQKANTADVKALEKLQTSATLPTFLPSFVCNLLSIPQLCMDGWKVTFIHRACILERDDIRIEATNTAKDELFRLSTDREGQ